MQDHDNNLKLQVGLDRQYAWYHMNPFHYSYFGMTSYVQYVLEKLSFDYSDAITLSEIDPWSLGVNLQRLKRELDSRWVNKVVGTLPSALMKEPRRACEVGLGRLPLDI